MSRLDPSRPAIASTLKRLRAYLAKPGVDEYGGSLANYYGQRLCTEEGPRLDLAIARACDDAEGEALALVIGALSRPDRIALLKMVGRLDP